MKFFGKELTFNNNKVYHAGDKPTPSEIGAAAASHGTHVTWATGTPKANGTAAVGTVARVAREDHIHPLQTTVSGNAGTATKLQTARTLTIGSTGKSFDGSANVSWSLNEIGAATGKTASATTAATAQWYRIATSPAGISRCIGNFTIEATVSGKHSVTNLIAGVNYGVNPTIQQIAHSDYSAPGITKARIVYHTTYNNNYAYLEVYQPTATATQINVSAVNLVGWTLVAPNTVGSIPSGYTSKEITFVNNKIVANIQGSVSGSASSATKATQDSAGQQINTTYIKGLSVSGKTITYTKGDGTTGTITTQDTDTDTKVTNTLNTTAKAYITGTTSASTNTGTQIFDTGVYLDTTAGMLTATTFKGALSGNASTASKWATTRTITLKGNANGSTNIDGSGNITINTHPRIFSSAGTSGTSGYVAFAQIVVTANYVNRPIEFKLISRGRATAGTVSIMFANTNNTDPALSSLRYWGSDYGVFAHKTATSTWLLYCTKSEAYDEITLVGHDYGSQGVTVTYPGSFITEKPTSNVTNASLGGNFGHANTATKLSTARTIKIGNTSRTFDGSANITWTAADIGVASINDSTTATSTVWSSNKTQVEINNSYNSMNRKVEALEEGVYAEFISRRGDTMTGDLTIKKLDGSAAKIKVFRTISSKEMEASMDIYNYDGGSAAINTWDRTSGTQMANYVFGGIALFAADVPSGKRPELGLSNYRFEKGWLNKLDVKDAIYTSGTITNQGGTTYLSSTVLANNHSLYGKKTDGTNLINICGVDNSNNIYLGWGNETYINVNNTMRTSRDLHVMNGAAMRVTGHLNVARTTDYTQLATFQTAGDSNAQGDGQTHIGYYNSGWGGYTHYFRGGGPVIVDNLNSLQITKDWFRLGGKYVYLRSATPSSGLQVGDIWIQI